MRCIVVTSTSGSIEVNVICYTSPSQKSQRTLPVRKVSCKEDNFEVPQALMTILCFKSVTDFVDWNLWQKEVPLGVEGKYGLTRCPDKATKPFLAYSSFYTRNLTHF